MEPEMNQTPMNKAKLPVIAIVMLVISCILGTVALVPLFMEGMFTYGAIDALFIKGKTLGDALGGVFLFLFVIMLGIATMVCGLVCLPFNIILLKKVGKKWYSLTLLIVTIVVIVLALLMIITIPVISNTAPSSSSSSMDSSSMALLSI